MIDLRSDTVTKPSHEMMQAIIAADFGDDHYGENKTTNALEAYCATFFKKEKSLFFSSGTMANLAAVLASVEPGNELIMDASYHMNFFESSQLARFAGVAINLTQSPHGIMSVEELDAAVNSRCRSFEGNKPALLCLENTINSHAGKIFPLPNLKTLRAYTSENNMRIHLDGARLFNACAVTNINPADYASHADSLMISFTKGFGAPYGAILVGDAPFILKAKKLKKNLGGGLHQSGAMAAAAFYALKMNLNYFQQDNAKAKQLESLIIEIKEKVNFLPVETNILMIDLKRIEMLSSEFCKLAQGHGLGLYPWDKYRVRAVTHMDISNSMIIEAANIIKKLVFEI